jgi:hypothetical protein
MESPLREPGKYTIENRFSWAFEAYIIPSLASRTKCKATLTFVLGGQAV